MTLFLHGLGHFHPETEITNRFLQELEIGTDDAWIVERTGIHTRRTVLALDYIRDTQNRDPRAAAAASLYTNAEMGKRAAELALARSGLTRDRVGLVIVGGCAPDTTTPAEACNLARELELEVPGFDVNSACTSFFAALWMLSQLDTRRAPDFILLVAIEGVTRTVDYTDRATAVLWGDGAAAAVLSTRLPGRAVIDGSALFSDPSKAGRVVIPRGGHFAQEGSATQKFAITRSIEQLERIRELDADSGRPLHFVGHQANLRMLEAVCRRCDIPDERHHSNVEWYGNTGASSAMGVVSQAWEKWLERDQIALVGVGSGLTWGGCRVRFLGSDGDASETSTHARC